MALVTISRSLWRPRLGVARERGSSSLEMAIVFFGFFLLIAGVIQGGVYYHARNVALAAAQEGVQVAASEAGSAEAGRAAALSFLGQANSGNFLSDVGVSAERSAVEVQVTVSGRSPSLVPLVEMPLITQSARGEVERVTAP